VFGRSAQFWIILQTTHDLSKAAIKTRGELEAIKPLVAA
jgi:plasmid maintenance system antidote protein VapI